MAFFVLPSHNGVLHNDDFFGGIANPIEGMRFLNPLFFVRDIASGLNAIPLAAAGGKEINLMAFPFPSFPRLNDTHIDVITAISQFVVDDVFHKMGVLMLPKADGGISQTQILKVDFIGGY